MQQIHRAFTVMLNVEWLQLAYNKPTGVYLTRQILYRLGSDYACANGVIWGTLDIRFV